MENGCSQRSGPSSPDDTCCRTPPWRSSWPTGVRRHSIVHRDVLKFFISGSIWMDILTFLCGSPQWRSCSTSQMQPWSRRWSTVFHELGWERTLVCHRQGDTRPLQRLLQGWGRTILISSITTHTIANTHTVWVVLNPLQPKIFTIIIINSNLLFVLMLLFF